MMHIGKDKERSNAHNALFDSFNLKDPRSFAVMQFIEEVYPAFAEKLFNNNYFMEMLVTSQYNPMDILDYPVCGRCETLAAWDRHGVKDGRRYRACSCFAKGCGHRTINPVTLRYWMRDELKSKAPPLMMERVEDMVDETILGMLKLAQRQVDDALVERFSQLNPKMGQPEEEPDFTAQPPPKPKVQVKEGKLSEKYEDMIAKEDKQEAINLDEDVYMEDEDDV